MCDMNIKGQKLCEQRKQNFFGIWAVLLPPKIMHQRKMTERSMMSTQIQLRGDFLQELAPMVMGVEKAQGFPNLLAVFGGGQDMCKLF